jgi:hypothetical protein
MGTVSKGDSASRNGISTNFSFSVDDDGNATISASDDIMRNISPGRYVYDLQQIVDNVSTTILEGNFIVNDDISKAIG